jgi:hypothetical protein
MRSLIQTLMGTEFSTKTTALHTLAREDGEGLAMVPLTYWEIYVTSYFLYCIVNCYLTFKGTHVTDVHPLKDNRITR